MIEITAIRLDGGEQHVHISEMQWASGVTVGVASIQSIVGWLNGSSANKAVVGDGGRGIPVLVVAPADGPAHLRACSRGRWRDDLLELPRF